MLNAKYVELLPPGDYSNQFFYGTNGIITGKAGEKIPVYLNRRQRRERKFAYRLKMSVTPYAKKKRGRSKLIRPMHYLEVDPNAIKSAVAAGKPIKDFSGKVLRSMLVKLLKIPHRPE